MAAKKKKNQGQTVIAVCKGNADVAGISIKQRATEVLFMFMEMATDAKFHNGKHTMLLKCEDHRGDWKWMDENVFAYVDIYGSNSENASREKASRLYIRYTDACNGEDKVGTDCIIRLMERMYMPYDIWYNTDGTEEESNAKN